MQQKGNINEVKDYSSNTNNFAVARFRTDINSLTVFMRRVFLFLFAWSIQAIRGQICQRRSEDCFYEGDSLKNHYSRKAGWVSFEEMPYFLIILLTAKSENYLNRYSILGNLKTPDFTYNCAIAEYAQLTEIYEKQQSYKQKFQEKQQMDPSKYINATIDCKICPS